MNPFKRRYYSEYNWPESYYPSNSQVSAGRENNVANLLALWGLIRHFRSAGFGGLSGLARLTGLTGLVGSAGAAGLVGLAGLSGLADPLRGIGAALLTGAVDLLGLGRNTGTAADNVADDIADVEDDEDDATENY